MKTAARIGMTILGIGLIALDAIVPGTAVPGGAIILAAWAIGGKS